MTSDSELLRRYAEQGDEAAFAEVARRHLSLVYASALRLLNGDKALAEDVTQTVFTELAGKAATLVWHGTVAGWLHNSVRFAASKAVRDEQCRRTHEQEASTMNDQTTSTDVSWTQLRPLLDNAVGHLGEEERNAVLLRFFEEKSHREVGEALGLSENTARMRVERAVEKLHGYFVRHGVTTTAALLATTLDTQAASIPPPPVFAATVVGKSLAGTAAAGMSTVTGMSSSLTAKLAASLAGVAAVGTFAVTTLHFWPSSNVVPAPAKQAVAVPALLRAATSIPPVTAPALPLVVPRVVASIPVRPGNAPGGLQPRVAAQMNVALANNGAVSISAFAAVAMPAASPPMAPATGSHTFTNAQGASFSGVIVNVQGDNVTIKREDGQSFVVKPEIFSPDDQAYIRQWAADEAAKAPATPLTAVGPTMADAPAQVPSASGAESTGVPEPVNFLTFTDADVHKIAAQGAILYVTVTHIFDDFSILVRVWKTTSKSDEAESHGKILKLPFATLSLDDQIHVKELAAQRSQDAASAGNTVGNAGIHVATWDIGAIPLDPFDYLDFPYLVDTSGVLKEKTITAIMGNALWHVVLCSDGTLAAWGDNSVGQLGNGQHGSGAYSISPVLVDLSALRGKTITNIAAVGQRCFALCSDGSIYRWGNGILQITAPMLVDPGALMGEAMVSNTLILQRKIITAFAGDHLSLLLCSDGTLLATDPADDSKLKPANAAGVLKDKAIAAISWVGGHNMVLCADSTIVHWGLCEIPGIYGQPAFDDIGAKNALKNPTSSQVGQLGLERRNSLISAIPVILPDASGILKGKTITTLADCEQSADGYNSATIKETRQSVGSAILALCTDGTLACWGAGREGPYPFSVADEPALKDALKGKTVKAIVNYPGGFLLLCSDGTLVHWELPGAEGIPFFRNGISPEKVTSYNYFVGRTILAMDSNAIVFK